MDYCKSLYCCWKLFGLSFSVRCWSSPWWLLRGYCGGVFGWRSCSKLPWFLVLLYLPGECTNSCVRMGSFVLAEVVGLGEEWWLTCVFNCSLIKDLFKGNCSLSVPGCLIPWPILHWSLEFLSLIKVTGWLTGLSSLSAGIICSTLSASWDLGLCLKGI